MNADKKIIIFLSFCLAFELALGWNFFAESKTIVLGGKTGWPELSSKEGVTFGTGRFGYEAVVLSTNARSVTDGTDLLLDFEGKDGRGFSDLAGFSMPSGSPARFARLPSRESFPLRGSSASLSAVSAGADSLSASMEAAFLRGL